MSKANSGQESKKGVLKVKTKKSIKVALAILSLAVMLPWGCGREAELIGPNVEKKEPTPLPLPPITQQELLSSSASGSTQVLVNAATGGSVKLGFCEVVIPPGALEQSTVISVAYADPYYAIFEMGPDGTQFAVPVTIRFDITAYKDYLETNNIDPNDLVIALRNEIEGVWVPLDTFVEDEHGHTWVETFTWHFSRYALAD